MYEKENDTKFCFETGISLYDAEGVNVLNDHDSVQLNDNNEKPAQMRIINKVIMQKIGTVLKSIICHQKSCYALMKSSIT